MAAISTTDLYNAYLAYFGRPPDLTGLVAYANQSEEQVLAAFSASPESQALLAGSSTQVAINNIYLNLFNRNAEYDGLIYWSNQVNDGTVSLADAAMAILRGAVGEDLDTVNAKNDAMVAFVEAINTTPEAIGYSGIEAANDARAFISTVGYHWIETADGPELDGAGLTVPTPEEVDAAVLEATTANVVADVDQELFLAVGQDSIMGGVANDLFIADIVQNSLGAQVNTLGTGDRLNGAEGLDRLDAQVTDNAIIQPRTTSIETVRFEAVNSHIGMDEVGSQVSLDLRGILDDVADIVTHARLGQLKLPDAISLLNITPVLEVSTTEVYVNAKDMLGVENLWSWHSDGNLTIQNLTTQTNSGNHSMRAVDTMTIGMGYTGNADSKWEESDMHVYFDQDYLNPAVTSTETSVNWELMNEDGYDVNAAKPLSGVYLTQMRFTLNGHEYDFVPYLDSANLQNKKFSNGTLIETYANMEAALKSALDLMKADHPEDLALQQATVQLGAPFTADIAPSTGLPRMGTQITLDVPGLQADGVTLNALSALDVGVQLSRTEGPIGGPDESAPNNNRWEQVDDTPPTFDQELRINVALEKAGNAGDGGELVIGSMSKEAGNHWDFESAHKGIQIFDVTVYGDEARSSNLSGLYSTNNTLREVNVVSDVAAGMGEKAYADLTIGNRETKMGATSNGNGYGLKDVAKFDSTGFYGDVSLTAVITSDSVAKYQNLVDTDADDKADDVHFSYKLGGGSDNITLTIDGNVSGYAVAGFDAVDVHDFDFLVDGGAGDDQITVNLASQNVDEFNPIFILYPHGLVPAIGNTMNWYNDQQVNHNITVNGGDGNDTIRTPGAGDVYINGDAGNDTIYSDNTGFDHANVLPLLTPTDNAAVYNDGRAVWVLNAVDGEVDIYDIESQAAAQVMAVNAFVTVSYRGVEKKVAIGNSNGAMANVKITDVTVNQAIKDAINNDPVLSKLIVAEDGAGRSLVVRSLIDGHFDASAGGLSALDITFSTVALSTAQLAAVPPVTLFNSATGYAHVIDGFDGTVTGHALNAVGEQFAVNPFPPLGTSDFVMDGANSITTSDNTITGGAGDDVIVLSTTNFRSTDAADAAGMLSSSNETVVYAPLFGADTIVNFDSTWNLAGKTTYAGAPAATEVVKLIFSASDGTPVSQTISFDGSTVILTATVQGVIPAVDVANQFVLGFTSANWTAALATGPGTVPGQVTLTHTGAGDVPDLSAASFAGSYFGAADGNGTVNVVTTTQGVTAGVLGALSTFAVNFTTAGTAAAAAGSFVFDGTTVNYAQGDGSVELAAKLKAGVFANWDTVLTAGSGATTTVTFTAKAPGTTTPGTAPDFDVDGLTSGIVGSITGAVTGTASTGTIITTVLPAGPGEGYDILDFTKLGGDISTQTDLTTIVSTNKSINVLALSGVTNDTAAHLKTMLDATAMDDVTASTHVVVVYNATTNVGSVYQVADGAGNDDTTVTLAGTIDLADTPWASLHTVNFV